MCNAPHPETRCRAQWYLSSSSWKNPLQQIKVDKRAIQINRTIQVWSMLYNVIMTVGNNITVNINEFHLKSVFRCEFILRALHIYHLNSARMNIAKAPRHFTANFSPNWKDDNVISDFHEFHRIGLWEKLQDSPIFHGKNHGFLQIFP